MAILGRFTARLAALLVVPALALSLAAIAAESDGKAKPNTAEGTAKSPIAAKKADRAQVQSARETLEALRELHAAVQKEQNEGGTVKLPDPPRKKVTAPTLTPAELDRLVATFLESSKTPPASVTTDAEF